LGPVLNRALTVLHAAAVAPTDLRAEGICCAARMHAYDSLRPLAAASM